MKEFKYEITMDGKVLSLDSNWRGYGPRELSQHLNSHGYPSVRIYINGQRKRMPVHVLVAQNYLPPRPSSSHQIRHLDGDKTNNHFENLAWGTAKENADDRKSHGRTSCGVKHSKATRRGLVIKKLREAGYVKY
ncbi:HNH endonuclease [Cronobacter sakazakii]|nr:HNH endonuclease [Cronobacter sakazakii]ELY5800598.1 HNH endonuclease [Cronobacter sakazakii]